MMARRISGSDGCGGGPLGTTFFPPPRRRQAPVLQIGKGDAGHQRVAMQAGPGPAFEVAEAELLLELLVHLPQRTALRRLVATVKARWSCEQVHQQLKQELGLGDFEGRSWTGLHRHALMTGIAFAYLQHRRLKAAGRGKKGGSQRTAATAVAA